MSNLNSSYIGTRKDLLRHISGQNKVVLDIGCATGENGNFLLTNKIADKVIGIEIDHYMGDISREKLTQVIVGNIEKKEVRELLPQNLRYDYIILGDVLEHLIDPWEVLHFLSGLLKSDGRIIISLPNVQHIDVLIHVFIRGVWPYNDRGIFDRTHFRWFTYKNMVQLVEHCGLSIITTDRNFRYRDKPGVRFPFYGILLKTLFKNLYTHQYVLVCKKRVS